MYAQTYCNTHIYMYVYTYLCILLGSISIPIRLGVGAPCCVPDPGLYIDPKRKGKSSSFVVPLLLSQCDSFVQNSLFLFSPKIVLNQLQDRCWKRYRNTNPHPFPFFHFSTCRERRLEWTSSRWDSSRSSLPPLPPLSTLFLISPSPCHRER